jgi:hypothetical protein
LTAFCIGFSSRSRDRRWGSAFGQSGRLPSRGKGISPLTIPHEDTGVALGSRRENLLGRIGRVSFLPQVLGFPHDIIEKACFMARAWLHGELSRAA